MVEKAVQGSKSMKPKFRNATFLITQVWDMCVKFLVASNISSTQGRSLVVMDASLCGNHNEKERPVGRGNGG